MQKISSSKFAKIVPFLVGLMIALGLFYVFQNFDLFQANILSIHDKDILMEQDWDVGYKTENNLLDVYLSENIKDISGLVLEILFDETELVFDIDNIVAQGNVSLVSSGGGALVYEVADIVDLDSDESLFLIPYSGGYMKPILGFVSVIGIPEKKLSIGNLNISVGEHIK